MAAADRDCRENKRQPGAHRNFSESLKDDGKGLSAMRLHDAVDFGAKAGALNREPVPHTSLARR
jgi:hypothetical protein